MCVIMCVWIKYLVHRFSFWFYLNMGSKFGFEFPSLNSLSNICLSCHLNSDFIHLRIRSIFKNSF